MFLFVFKQLLKLSFNFSDSPEHSVVPLSDQEIQNILLSQNEKLELTAEQQLTRSMQMERGKRTNSIW